MRTSPLVATEPDGPLVVEDSAERAEVIALFERHGVLLFRGLDIEPSNLVAFTNQFAQQYAPDAIAWQPRDLLMIDNRRFMHGRRAFEADDVRDISIVQVLRASFAFGASTRTALG